MNRYVLVALGGCIAVALSILRFLYARKRHEDRLGDWASYRQGHIRHRLGTETVRLRGTGWVRVGIYNVENGRMPGKSIRVTTPDQLSFDGEGGQRYVLRRGAYLRLHEVDGTRDVEVSDVIRAVEIEAGAELRIYGQWPEPSAPGEAVVLEPMVMHPQASPRFYVSSHDPEVGFERVLDDYARARGPKPYAVGLWMGLTCAFAMLVSAMQEPAASLTALLTWSVAIWFGEISRWREMLARE